MDKDRLWKELEASPEKAFKELLRAYERESHEKEVRRLEKFASDQIGLWTRMKKEAKTSYDPLQEKLKTWVEKYGIFRMLSPKRDLKGKAHLWNPTSPHQLLLCSASRPDNQFEEMLISFDPGILLEWEICSTCASSNFLRDGCAVHTYALGILWFRHLPGPTLGDPAYHRPSHLRRADGTLLCANTGGRGTWGRFCDPCMQSMGGIEDFKKEIEAYTILNGNPE